MAEGEALLPGGFRGGVERHAEPGESSLFSLLAVLGDGDGEGDALLVSAGGVAVAERDRSLTFSE